MAGRVASPLQSLAQKPVTAFAEKFPQTAAKMQASASAIPGAVRDAAINTTSAVFGVAQDLATLGSRSLGYVNGAALGDMALNGGPKVTVNNEHTRKVNNMHDSSSNVTITAPNIPIGLALSADPKLINRLPFVPGLNEAQGNAMPRTDVRYEGDDPYRARQITTGSIRPFGEINLSYMAGSKEIGFVSSTTIAPHEALYNFAAVEFDKNTRPNNDQLSLSSYLGNTFLKISGSNRFNLGPLAVLIPRMSATTPLAEITNDKGQAPLVLGGRDDIGRGPAITLNPSSGFLNPATRGADWTPQKAFAEIFKPIPTTTYTPTK